MTRAAAACVACASLLLCAFSLLLGCANHRYQALAHSVATCDVVAYSVDRTASEFLCTFPDGSKKLFEVRP